MKKLIVLLLILSLVLLCGCQNAGNGDATTTAPSATDPVGSGNANGTVETTKPIEWETPIDIDDSFQQTEPSEPAASETTEPSATEPGATQPDTTEPTASEPTVSEPAATDPAPTESAPADPEPTNPFGSKPIELPMVPG